MSQTQCPSCGFEFDNHRPRGAEALRGRLLFGPERLITKARVDANAFDACPSCANRFVAPEVAIAGKFVRAKLGTMGALYGTVAFAVVALVAVLLVSGG